MTKCSEPGSIEALWQECLTASRISFRERLDPLLQFPDSTRPELVADFGLALAIFRRPGKMLEGESKFMKRLSYFALPVLLTAGLALPAHSQKPADPCAQYKTAPKGETAAAKKTRQADLKTCNDQQKAAKQKSQPTKKPSGQKD
jgi:hypothetical protein